nr:PREDICTED: bromodomain-containing protein 3-like [Bemisia tabaci]
MQEREGAENQETDNAQPMTFQEKQRLSFNINRLAGSDLAEIINIIQSREPRLSENPDEVELDFETLQPRTLRELETFVFLRLGQSYYDPIAEDSDVEASLDDEDAQDEDLCSTNDKPSRNGQSEP